MSEIHILSRPHTARAGAPVIDRVDVAIFDRRYFTHCMQHPTCRDWCCAHGVDVDEGNVARILARAPEIEQFTGIDRARWFTDAITSDPEFPSGAYRRTRVEDGACVFLDRASRGCRIHAFSIHVGLDYHELKPIVSTLFPLTFDEGLLHASEEVDDHTLVCLDEGPTLYQGLRGELNHYFDEALIAELDALERSRPAPPLATAASHKLRVLR